MNAGQLPALHFARDIIPLLTKAGLQLGRLPRQAERPERLQALGVRPRHPGRLPDACLRRARAAAVSRCSSGVAAVDQGGQPRAARRRPAIGRGLGRISAAGALDRRRHAAGRRRGSARRRHRRAAPSSACMREGSQQRLLVTARLSDGTLRDVTSEAVYSSNDETLATVDRDGRIATTMMAGESAIVVRYQEHVAASFITVPLNQRGGRARRNSPHWDRSHFIDRLVAEKWERLHLSPSPPADDATFHRRAYLDLIGKLPTPGRGDGVPGRPSRRQARPPHRRAARRGRNTPTIGHSSGPTCSGSIAKISGPSRPIATINGCAARSSAISRTTSFCAS